MKKIFAFLKANKVVFSILIVSLISATAIGSGVILYNYKLNNKVCEVKFDTKGGTVIKEQQVKCGKNIKIPNDPSKEGFSFKYWSYNQEKYDFSKPILNNITLEAYYEEENVKEEITISFNSNGGSKIESIQIVSGNKTEKPVNPTKKGYKFIGWFVESNEFDFNSPIYEDIELIAKWEKESSDNKNSIITSPNGYDCSGSFTSNIPEKIVTIGYSENINSIWNTGEKYKGECYFTYKTSNSNIADISNKGIITTKSKGNVYIYKCINDVNTKKELVCFKSKLAVVSESASIPKFSDVQGVWYKVGTNNETITFSYEDGKYHAGTFFFFFYTLEINHDQWRSGLYDPSWENIVSYYNMRNVTSSTMTISRGSKTINLTRTAAIIKTNRIAFVGQKDLVLGDSNVIVGVTVSPGNATVTQINWASSNTNVVTVTGSSQIMFGAGESGVGYNIYLNAVGVGTATITVSAQDGGATSSFQVNVTKVDVNSISLNKSSLSLTKGNFETLIATINPSNASDKTISWSSSDSSIASVDSNGKVTAVGKGTATITVTTKDGNRKATCLVDVINPPLTATASIGMQVNTTSNGISRGISTKVVAKGGTGVYSYYYIKLYREGTLIGQTSNTSSNSLYVDGYGNGNYYAEFEVHDSDGTVYKSTSGTTTISGF